ncbi:hypothetical protein [Dactylosporangium sp. CA-139066]|uniref:hypothetical protein n=1 Tax=Dactylosporangium sp. CA-139066 TaxID=3239930 RepID=UPI003D8A30B5
MLSQRLDTGTDLSLLQSSHPALADELAGIRRERNRDPGPAGLHPRPVRLTG